jgi:hypothetical protein
VLLTLIVSLRRAAMVSMRMLAGTPSTQRDCDTRLVINGSRQKIPVPSTNASAMTLGEEDEHIPINPLKTIKKIE